MEPDGALLQLHPPAQHSRLRAIRCTRRQGLRISPARSPTVLGPPPAPSTDHIGAHSANPLGWLVESNPRHLTDNSCPRSSGSQIRKSRSSSVLICAGGCKKMAPALGGAGAAGAIVLGRTSTQKT